MKRMLRALSLLICFALLVTLVPANFPVAFASEAEEERVILAETPAPQAAESSAPEKTDDASDDPTPDAPSEGENGSSEPSISPSPDASAEPSVDPSAEPSVEPSAGAPEDEQLMPADVDEVPAINYSDKASKSPAFVKGFAEILEKDTEVFAGNAASDEVVAWLGRGVVYVLSRTPEDSSKPDRLQVAFNADPEKDIQTGWIDAAAARPMDPVEGGEVDQYKDACRGVDGVRCYANDSNYPLRVIECAYPAPVTVSLSQSSATIGVGDKGVTLRVQFSDGRTTNADGTPRAVKFTSSATKYVTVDANSGRLNGVRKGSATITATTAYGSVSCKVTVKSAPKSISATPSSAEILIGETTTIAPKFASASYGGSCTFQSSDPSIATVAADGTVTGVSKGQATIYIYAYNLPSKPAKATVRVYGPATSVAFSEDSISLCSGMERKLSVVLPEFERENCIFTSSDDAVASVEGDGLLRANGQGSATITATSVNTGVRAICTVRVLPSPAEENVVLSASSYKLGLNESFSALDLIEITGGCHAEFSFKSSNTKYVKVDAAGKVTGLRAGSATLTITTHNGIVRTVKVTVYKNPTSVAFASKALTLGVGMSAVTKVSFNSTSAYSQHSFISSDEAVATVDPVSGVVTARAVGTAVIACVPQKGKTGVCTVTVLPAPTEISASADALEIGLGETGRSVTGKYPEGTMCSFTYASEDPGVVTVNAETGALTTVSTGSTNILITSHNGASVKCRVDVKKAPEKLTLNQSTMKLMVGETNGTLVGTVEEGAASGITLSSSNVRYVKIADGKLVGVKAGTVTITAKTYNGVKATCKVTVYAKPTSVAFSSKSISLGTGDSASVTLKFNSTKVYSPCSFESSDPSVATIDQNTGVITAHKMGTATLKATTLNGKSATCTVSVLPAPERIQAAQSEINLGVGESGLRVAGVYPEGTLCSFSYKSADESILTVNAATGEITALRAGSADVFITAHNGATASCRVNVKNAPTSLALNKSTMKLMVGETNDTLVGIVNEGAASAISLSSSNTRYVKASGGKLVGVKAGTVTITAKTYNGVKATCKVTVCAAPKSVSFKTKSLVLGCGESVATDVVYNPSKAYSLCSYSSSDPSVVTVDPVTGAIQGVAPGRAVITAKPQKGTAGTCTVEVRPAPDSVALPQSSCEIAEGMTLALTPVFPEGTAGQCSFTSSDPTVATVDAGGAVKGIGGGTATITVTTYNGHSASCTVTVTPAPATLKYDFTKITMLKGDRIQIPEPTAYDASGNVCPSTYTYSASSTRYATISGNTVKGVKTGTITITAKSYNGKKASFKLTIASSVTGLTLAPSAATLYTNGADYVDTLQLSVSMASGTVANVQFASSNPGVATVSETGLVTPVAPGTASIGVKTVSGSVATASITVKRLSSSIALDCTELELGEGEQHQLRPQLDPGSEAVITYTISDDRVVTVDNNGLIRAVSSGMASVTATMQDGKRASVNLTVLPGPTAIALKPEAVRLAVGEGVLLSTELSASAENYCRKVSYSSENPAVVTVDATGALLAVGEGETRVTATACNGLTASCRVQVTAAAEGAQLAFEKDSFGIVCGDSAELPLMYTKAAIERGFTVTSSDPEILRVDGLRVTADSERAGEVTVTLTVNPAEGAEDAPVQASCTVLVCEYVKIDLPEQVSMKTNSSYALEYSMLPENLLGVCSFEVENPELISFDPATGVIESNSLAGSTNLVFRSFNRSMNCAVTVVNSPKYRALIVGSYNNSGASNDLPFIGSNMSNVYSALSKSSVDGERYAITSDSNPSKGRLQSLVTGTFRDAAENDVSVIYIVTHGYYQATASGYYGYYFSLAPNYSKEDPSTYVTAGELMNWMSGIPGNVVLVLDSCRSGGFIVDCAGKISASGRISVLTAQTFDQNASFYQGTSAATTVEFLTYAFCRGLGVDQMRGTLGSMYADDDGDGAVTIAEAFSYAKTDCEYQVALKRGTFKETANFSKWMAATGCIKVPSIYKKSDFDNWYQSPQYMLATGTANGVKASDVVLSAW